MILNEKVLKAYGLSSEEFLLMYAFILSPNMDVVKVRQSICYKHLLFPSKQGMIPCNQVYGIIKDVFNSSCPVVVKEEDRLMTLVDELQKVFPEGRKEGTSYYWHGNRPEILRKLRYLVKEGAKFTNEEAIQAAKSYVDSFKGDYRYMQLLKYFLSKKDRATGEEKSEFLSYLENAEQHDVSSDDWASTLI